MIRHFINLLLRSMWSQRLYTAINVVGLVLGLSISLVIYLYVSRELSVDKSVAVQSNTYRLLRHSDINGTPYLIGITSGPFAEALLTDFPHEVKETTRVMKSERWARYEESIYLEENFAFADSNFFRFFAFDLMKGSKEKALSQPNNVIITQATARKYFGQEDPINKLIRVSDRYDLVVTGVLADLPYPTHLKFDLIANISLMRERDWFSQWWNNAMVTYLSLHDQVDLNNFNQQLPQFMDKYFGEDFASNRNRIDLVLQPIEDVYFQNDVRYDPVPHGNKRTVFIFVGIGIFILFIAIINYVNLATAKSLARAREVGIKKALGSTRKQLIIQFIFESAIITSMALCIALMMVEVLLPIFNSYYQLELTFQMSWPLLIKIIAALAIISLLAGLYPSFILSSFKPIHVLKGRFSSGRGSNRFRKLLVVVQFAISSFLIIGTLIVGQQLHYIQSKPLGFNKNQLVIVESSNNAFYNSRQTFQTILESNPSVVSVCLMSGEPGGFHDTMSLQVEGLEENPRMRTNFVDENFAETFGLEFAAGRNFSKQFPSDLAEALILNETAVKELGWSAQDAIGKRMRIQMMDSTMKTVVGVVRDFHFSSLHSPIEPLVLSMSNEGGSIGIKVRADDIPTAIASIEDAWKTVTPQYPFYYQFLDDRLNRHYQSELLQGRLFQLLSLISIVVAALGIIGLATFTSIQRQKEVGVRKVFGASVGRLTILLMKDLILLTFIATLIAWPFSYWLLDQWLTGFAYRINIKVEIFALATIITLVISIASVSYQSLKVALSNPVNILKEE